MSLREASAAIGAKALGADARFLSVSTDSRTLSRGALFVALRGERFDGHHFLDAARERGAAAAMVVGIEIDGRARALLSWWSRRILAPWAAWRRAGGRASTFSDRKNGGSAAKVGEGDDSGDTARHFGEARVLATRQPPTTSACR